MNARHSTVLTFAASFLVLRRSSESESGTGRSAQVDRERKKATPARSRSRGCSPRSHGLFRSRHDEAASLEREHRRSISRTTPDDLDEIDSVASKIEGQGARYPEEMERRTGL